jgi:hypothetical protein
VLSPPAPISEFPLCSCLHIPAIKHKRWM